MKLTKQTALKAALLAVLAANISWEKVDFQSVRLASDGATSEVVAGKPAQPAAANSGVATSTSPDAITLKANGAPPEAAKLTLPRHEAELRVCGDAYKVIYQQVSRADGKMMTEITAMRPSRSNDASVLITWKEDLINTMVNKSEADNVLTAAVKAQRTLKKESCAGDPVVAQQKDEEKAKAEEERTRIADGMKSCTLDRKGEPLKGSTEKLTCWVDQLNKVGQRVGKRKSDESERAAVLAELQRIVRGSFKRQLKEALLSEDDERVETAKGLATDAMDTIAEVAAEYGLGRSKTGRSNNSISKLIGEISALKHGAETVQKSEEYEERAKEVRDNLRSARSEFATARSIRDQAYQAALRNPLDPYTQQAYAESNQVLAGMQYSMQEHVGQYERLRYDIGLNLEPTYIRPLRSMQTSGLMNSADFNEFTKPYLELQKMLRETRNFANMNPQSVITRTSGFSGQIKDSVLGADFTVPADLAVIRPITRTTPAAGSGAIPRGLNGLPSAAPSLSLPAPRSIFSNP